MNVHGNVHGHPPGGSPIVPLLVVFAFGARHFVRNVAAGALKG